MDPHPRSSMAGVEHTRRQVGVVSHAVERSCVRAVEAAGPCSRCDYQDAEEARQGYHHEAEGSYQPHCEA